MRKYILLTLSRADKEGRAALDKKEIADRIRGCFSCISIIVAREQHEEIGHHFHIAIRNICATRDNAPKKLRKAFPEFEGAQMLVTFHKAWATACQYVMKEDPKPLVWGEDTVETIKEMLAARKGHKGTTKREIMQKLKGLKDWYETYEDPELHTMLLSKENALKNVFEDIQVIKDRESQLKERIKAPFP